MTNMYDLNAQSRTIDKIIDILTTPGEYLTDGECIDMIWNTIVRELHFNLEAVKEFKEHIMNQSGGK